MADELSLARKPEDPQAIKPRPREDGQEFGISIRLPFSTPYTPPRGVEKRRKEELFEVFSEKAEDEPDILQLQAMRRTDGQARALYRLITLPIRSALRTSKFVPAEDGGEEEAEFAENMLTLPFSGGGMQTAIRTVVAQMLMAVFDGYSAFEQVIWRPKRGPLEGKWTLHKIAHRPAETITFITDDHGEYKGIRQRTVIHGKEIDEFIDAKSSIYFTVQEEERPFYGVSYFQSAFNHFDKKVKLYYIAHLSAQHRAVGSRIGKAPASASQKERDLFLSHMSDFGFAQAMLLPKDFEVEHQYPTAQADFLDLINHHNSQMSKSVLAAFFDDSQGGGADNALVDFGKQSDSMFTMMLQALMDDMAALFNDRIIPKFIDWNFGTEKYPQFTWGTFTNEQKEAIHSTFEKLSVAGQTLTATPEFVFELEKHMAEELGLEIDYKEIEKNKLAEKEKQDMQAQQQGDFFGSSGGFPPKAPKTPEPPKPAGQVGSRLPGPSAAQKAPKPQSRPPEPVPFTDTAREDAVELTEGDEEQEGDDVVLSRTGDEIALAQWRESQHPRDREGKFAEKPGGPGMSKAFDRALMMTPEIYAIPTGRGTAHFRLYKDGTAQYVNARGESTELKEDVARRRIKARGFVKQGDDFQPARPRRPKGMAVLDRQPPPKKEQPSRPSPQQRAIQPKTAAAEAKPAPKSHEDFENKVKDEFELGRSPIPKGSLRLYHYTPLENVTAIRGEGLDQRKARGDGNLGFGNEPSAGVWASTQPPKNFYADSGYAIVEFHAKPEEISERAESPWRVTSGLDTVEDWQAGNHHVIMADSVSPEKFVRVHEPWEQAALYMAQDDDWREQYAHVLDTDDEWVKPYQRAYRELLKIADAKAPKTRGQATKPLPENLDLSQKMRRGSGPIQRLSRNAKSIAAKVPDANPQWTGFDRDYIGHIFWNRESGEVEDIWINPDWRRRGIATALWQEAKKQDPNVKHSETQTPAGAKWAKTAPLLVAPELPSLVKPLTRSDFSNPDTPRSRAVSQQEFEELHEEGRVKMEKLRAESSTPEGLDKRWDDLVAQAFKETRAPWGGITIDAHTGEPVDTSNEAYALSVKPNGIATVLVSPDASRYEFRKAMDEARRRFDGELRNQQAHLGVFHDEDTGHIEIDPVLVVDNMRDVESIGSYTRAVGGAYAFHDGDGYWPPHVQESESVESQTASQSVAPTATVQRTGTVASASEAGAGQRVQPGLRGTATEGKEGPFEAIKGYDPKVEGFEDNARVEAAMRRSAAAFGTAEPMEDLSVRGADKGYLIELHGSESYAVHERTMQGESILHFDHRLFSEEDNSLKERARNESRDGWIIPSKDPQTQPEMSVYHEIGHELTLDAQNAVLRADPDIWKEEVTGPLARALGVKPPTSGSAAATKQWHHDNVELIYDEVSHYAATQLDEMYAELWAEYVDDPENARPAAKAFSQGVARAYKRARELEMSGGSTYEARFNSTPDGLPTMPDTMTYGEGQALDYFWENPSGINEVMQNVPFEVFPPRSTPWSQEEMAAFETADLPSEPMQLDNMAMQYVAEQPFKAYWAEAPDAPMAIDARFDNKEFAPVVRSKDLLPEDASRYELLVQPGTPVIPSTDGSIMMLGRWTSWTVVGQRDDGTWMVEVGPPDRYDNATMAMEVRGFANLDEAERIAKMSEDAFDPDAFDHLQLRGFHQWDLDMLGEGTLGVHLEPGDWHRGFFNLDTDKAVVGVSQGILDDPDNEHIEFTHQSIDEGWAAPVKNLTVPELIVNHEIGHEIHKMVFVRSTEKEWELEVLKPLSKAMGVKAPNELAGEPFTEKAQTRILARGLGQGDEYRRVGSYQPWQTVDSVSHTEDGSEATVWREDGSVDVLHGDEAVQVRREVPKTRQDASWWFRVHEEEISAQFGDYSASMPHELYANLWAMHIDDPEAPGPKAFADGVRRLWQRHKDREELGSMEDRLIQDLKESVTAPAMRNRALVPKTTMGQEFAHAVGFEDNAEVESIAQLTADALGADRPFMHVKVSGLTYDELQQHEANFPFGTLGAYKKDPATGDGELVLMKELIEEPEVERVLDMPPGWDPSRPQDWTQMVTSWAEIVRQDQEKGMSPKMKNLSPAEYVVTHELGHMVYFDVLEGLEADMPREDFLDPRPEDHPWFHEEVVIPLSKALGVDPPHFKLSEDGELIRAGFLWERMWMRDNTELLREKVGGYGGADWLELNAELWAQYVDDPDNPIARAYGDGMVKLRDRMQGGSEWAEKRAANRARHTAAQREHERRLENFGSGYNREYRALQPKTQGQASQWDEQGRVKPEHRVYESNTTARMRGVKDPAKLDALVQRSADAIGDDGAFFNMEIEAIPEPELRAMAGGQHSVGGHRRTPPDQNNVLYMVDDFLNEPYVTRDLYDPLDMRVVHQSWNDLVGRDQRTGFSVSTKNLSPVEAVVTHEIGHELEHEISATVSQAEWDEKVLKPVAEAMGIDELPNRRDVFGEQEWLAKYRATIAVYVSDYAASSEGEMYADLWTMYVDDPEGNEAAQAYGDALRDLKMKELYGEDEAALMKAEREFERDKQAELDAGQGTLFQERAAPAATDMGELFAALAQLFQEKPEDASALAAAIRELLNG